MFEKSPQVAPLLVRLYDSHKLYGSVKEGKPMARAELTGAVVDLLDMDLSGREQELLADVLLGLMRQAEKDLRKALSERLAGAKNVPLRLALFLANDEISVAAPVLQKSTVFSDLDLVYIIKSKGSLYWQAIAARENLSAEVIEMLAETRDEGTAFVLSRNERITLTNYALEVLTETAQKSEMVARPLLQRKEMPPQLAQRLYEYVGQELKDYIRNYFGIQDGALSIAVDETIDGVRDAAGYRDMAERSDMILDFADPEEEKAPPTAKPLPPKYLSPQRFMPTEDILKLAEKYERLGMLNTQLAMDALEAGRISEFIAYFARYTGLATQTMHDALCKKQPKGLAIACRAFGIQKSDFAKIYLLTNAMRSVNRKLNHREMLSLLEYFDRIRPETARKIIAQAGHTSMQ